MAVPTKYYRLSAKKLINSEVLKKTEWVETFTNDTPDIESGEYYRPEAYAYWQARLLEVQERAVAIAYTDEANEPEVEGPYQSGCEIDYDCYDIYVPVSVDASFAVDVNIQKVPLALVVYRETVGLTEELVGPSSIIDPVVFEGDSTGRFSYWGHSRLDEVTGSIHLTGNYYAHSTKQHQHYEITPYDETRYVTTVPVYADPVNLSHFIGRLGADHALMYSLESGKRYHIINIHTGVMVTQFAFLDNAYRYRASIMNVDDCTFCVTVDSNSTIPLANPGNPTYPPIQNPGDYNRHVWRIAWNENDFTWDTVGIGSARPTTSLYSVTTPVKITDNQVIIGSWGGSPVKLYSCVYTWTGTEWISSNFLVIIDIGTYSLIIDSLDDGPFALLNENRFLGWASHDNICYVGAFTLEDNVLRFLGYSQFNINWYTESDPLHPHSLRASMDFCRFNNDYAIMFYVELQSSGEHWLMAQTIHYPITSSPVVTDTRYITTVSNEEGYDSYHNYIHAVELGDDSIAVMYITPDNELAIFNVGLTYTQSDKFYLEGIAYSSLALEEITPIIQLVLHPDSGEIYSNICNDSTIVNEFPVNSGINQKIVATDTNYESTVICSFGGSYYRNLIGFFGSDNEYIIISNEHIGKISVYNRDGVFDESFEQTLTFFQTTGGYPYYQILVASNTSKTLFISKVTEDAISPVTGGFAPASEVYLSTWDDTLNIWTDSTHAIICVADGAPYHFNWRLTPLQLSNSVYVLFFVSYTRQVNPYKTPLTLTATIIEWNGSKFVYRDNLIVYDAPSISHHEYYQTWFRFHTKLTESTFLVNWSSGNWHVEDWDSGVDKVNTHSLMLVQYSGGSLSILDTYVMPAALIFSDLINSTYTGPPLSWIISLTETNALFLYYGSSDNATIQLFVERVLVINGTITVSGQEELDTIYRGTEGISGSGVLEEIGYFKKDEDTITISYVNSSNEMVIRDVYYDTQAGGNSLNDLVFLDPDVGDVRYTEGIARQESSSTVKPNPFFFDPKGFAYIQRLNNNLVYDWFKVLTSMDNENNIFSNWQSPSTTSKWETNGQGIYSLGCYPALPQKLLDDPDFGPWARGAKVPIHSKFLESGEDNPDFLAPELTCGSDDFFMDTDSFITSSDFRTDPIVTSIMSGNWGSIDSVVTSYWVTDTHIFSAYALIRELGVVDHLFIKQSFNKDIVFAKVFFSEDISLLASLSLDYLFVKHDETYVVGGENKNKLGKVSADGQTFSVVSEAFPGSFNYLTDTKLFTCASTVSDSIFSIYHRNTSDPVGIPAIWGGNVQNIYVTKSNLENGTIIAPISMGFFGSSIGATPQITEDADGNWYYSHMQKLHKYTADGILIWTLHSFLHICNVSVDDNYDIYFYGREFTEDEIELITFLDPSFTFNFFESSVSLYKIRPEYVDGTWSFVTLWSRDLNIDDSVSAVFKQLPKPIVYKQWTQN